MSKIAASLLIAGLVALGLDPAQAQLARTFVSAAGGNDANDCNRATPCRTFFVAHDKTLANGEITVLDPGEYGGVAITKALSIVNDGVGEASINLRSSSQQGVGVAAGPDDAVSLRGLTITGAAGNGGSGIVFQSGKSLTIENCVVRGLTGAFPGGFGIVLQPTGKSSFSVLNTLVADNINGGLKLAPLGGSATAVFRRVEAYNNRSFGLLVSATSANGPVTATVADSVAAGSAVGFGASAGSGPASLMVVRSVSAKNDTGLQAFGATATLRVTRSSITANGAGLGAVQGGSIVSYGDNNIDGNGAGSESPTSTVAKR